MGVWCSLWRSLCQPLEKLESLTSLHHRAVCGALSPHRSSGTIHSQEPRICDWLPIFLGKCSAFLFCVQVLCRQYLTQQPASSSPHTFVQVPGIWIQNNRPPFFYGTSLLAFVQLLLGVCGCASSCIICSVPQSYRRLFLWHSWFQPEIALQRQFEPKIPGFHSWVRQAQTLFFLCTWRTHVRGGLYNCLIGNCTYIRGVWFSGCHFLCTTAYLLYWILLPQVEHFRPCTLHKCFELVCRSSGSPQLHQAPTSELRDQIQDLDESQLLDIPIASASPTDLQNVETRFFGRNLMLAENVKFVYQIFPFCYLDLFGPPKSAGKTPVTELFCQRDQIVQI